jgi:hypothetical protein
LLSFSDKFLKDFDLEKESFVFWVKKYINDFYILNKPQLYSIKIWNNNIRFHKIDIESNNQSWKKSKRAIVFFLLNSPDWINTIYPAFAFSTQEEKIYNSKLKNPDFVKSLRLKLEKYNALNENNIEL